MSLEEEANMVMPRYPGGTVASVGTYINLRICATLRLAQQLHYLISIIGTRYLRPALPPQRI